MDFDPFKKRISELNTLKPDAGRVLVAEPFLQDDYFKRSVVFICDTQHEGTVGFILNEPLDLKLSEVLPAKLDFDAPLFLGGPVEAESLFFIHTCAELKDSLKITDEVYWSGDFELLKEFLLIGKIGLHEVRFFLGYAGWDKQQLQNELDQESWLIGNISPCTLFDTQNSEDLWKDTLKKMGKEQAMLSTFPDDPSLN